MRGQSFPRRARLLKPAEFKRVFDRPVVSSDSLFKVLARAADGPNARLGMAVSRRVDSRASVRNRIKRAVRESFRLNHPVQRVGESPGESAGGGAQEHSPIRSPRDYVVLAAPPAAAAPNVTLAESLSRHWREVDRKLARAASAQTAQAGDIEK